MRFLSLLLLLEAPPAPAPAPAEEALDLVVVLDDGDLDFDDVGPPLRPPPRVRLVAATIIAPVCWWCARVVCEGGAINAINKDKNDKEKAYRYRRNWMEASIIEKYLSGAGPSFFCDRCQSHSQQAFLFDKDATSVCVKCVLPSSACRSLDLS